MEIHQLIWPDERIEHIAGHGVTPEEVEEVCFGKPFVRRAKSDGVNRYIMCWDKPKRGDTCFAW